MQLLFIVSGVLLTIMAILFIFMLTIKFDDEHKASKDSLHYKVFNILRFGDDFEVQPKTICKYYWEYVMYIILLPITIPIVLMGIIFSKTRDTTVLKPYLIMFWGMISLGSLIGLMIFQDPNGGFTIPLFLAIIIGIAISILIMATIIGVGFTIIWISDYIKRKKLNSTPKDKKKSMLKIRFKAWKDKNCPMINWD